MRRREFVLLLAAAPLARAQEKVRTIGLLWNDSVKPSPHVATLLLALNEKGWAAGRNLRIEDRVSLEGYGAMDDGAAALVRANVDQILAYGRTAMVAAAKVTKKIPIVAITGSDPVALGLAKSLSHPGGNLTGVLTLSGELAGKRVELLRELVPGLSKVGILTASTAAGAVEIRKDADAAARSLGLKPEFADVRSVDEIEDAIAALVKSQTGGLYVSASSMLAAHGTRVVAAVAKHRIPAVYANPRYVDTGALVVYGPSIDKLFVRAAAYVDRIFKGAKPGELPIERADVLELTVNLKAARAQGIKVPRTVLMRADRVIE